MFVFFFSKYENVLLRVLCVSVSGYWGHVNESYLCSSDTNRAFRNNTAKQRWLFFSYHPHYVMSSKGYLSALAQNMNKELILKIPLSLFILKLTLCPILRLTPSFICVFQIIQHTHKNQPQMSFFLHPYPWVFPFNFLRKK